MTKPFAVESFAVKLNLIQLQDDRLVVIPQSEERTTRNLIDRFFIPLRSIQNDKAFRCQAVPVAIGIVSASGCSVFKMTDFCKHRMKNQRNFCIMTHYGYTLENIDFIIP